MGLFSGIKKAISKTYKYVENATQDIGEGLWNVGDSFVNATGNLLQGDIKGMGENISNIGAQSGRITGALLGRDFANMSKDAAGSLTSYATLNANQGSQKAENVTGYDLDNSIAEAETARIKAENERLANEANAQAQRNRRANLLSMRKSLTPVIGGATATSGATSGANNGTGGIILG